jgi:type I restriction enzyme S subunit
MKQWRKVRLGDFLAQRKERVAIDPNTEYSLVTISKKGIIKLREKKKGAVISAKTGYIAKTGDFIYSRLSVHTGAFGIVPIELNNALITNEMPCFKIDENKIFPTILIKMIGLPDFIWQLNQLTQGVGRVRIKESMMLSLSLTLPFIKEQKIIVKKLKGIETEESDLKQEIIQQQALLKKLRQQILQEAIEGKLTQDWRAKNPNIEPASELLKVFKPKNNN